MARAAWGYTIKRRVSLRANSEEIFRFVLWRNRRGRAVFEYIEIDYNRTRRHSANGYLSPLAFESQQVA